MAGTEEYARSLNRVPHSLRKPLEAFLWDGIVPWDCLVVMALLCGMFPLAARLYGSRGMPISGAMVFIEEQFPDIAYGKPSYVVRWHLRGGMNGGNYAAGLDPRPGGGVRPANLRQ